MVVVTSFAHPDSNIHHEQRNTRVLLDKKDLGVGTLYVSERSLSWKEDGPNGFSIQYPHITLHAISNDTTVYPTECVYVMIDTHIQAPGSTEEFIQADSDSEVESEADISELILVPDDGLSIRCIYDALKDCQALNPSENDMDDDDDQDIYEDADENVIDVRPRFDDNGAGGDAEMDNLSNQLRNNSVGPITYSNGDGLNNDDQFEDAD